MSLATFVKVKRRPLVAFGDPSTFDRPLIFEAATISVFSLLVFSPFFFQYAEITQHVQNIHSILRLGYLGHFHSVCIGILCI